MRTLCPRWKVRAQPHTHHLPPVRQLTLYPVLPSSVAGAIVSGYTSGERKLSSVILEATKSRYSHCGVWSPPLLPVCVI